MKTEIEHVQHLLQKTKVKVQKDFEEWWKRSQSGSRRTTSPRAAWHTPPVPDHSQEGAGGERQRLSRHQEAIAAQLSLQQHSSLRASQPHSPASGARDGPRMTVSLGQTDSTLSSDGATRMAVAKVRGETDSSYGNGISRMAGKLGQQGDIDGRNLRTGDSDRHIERAVRRRTQPADSPQQVYSRRQPADSVSPPHQVHSRRQPAASVSPPQQVHSRRQPAATVSPPQQVHSRRQPADSVSPPQQVYSRTNPAGSKHMHTYDDDRYLSKQKALFIDSYDDTADRFVQIYLL